MVILRSGNLRNHEDTRIDEMETPLNLHKVQDSAEKLKPEDFLIASDKISGKSLLLLKQLYDLTKSAENDASSSSTLRRSLPTTLAAATTRLSSKGQKKKKKDEKNLYSRTEIPLPTLITQNFDQDQIWEEIQLQNGLLYESLVTSISKVLAHKPRAKEEQESEQEDDDESILRELNNLEDEEDDDELSDDFFESDEKYKRKKAKESKINKYSKSVVDDKFFNLAQMTEFVDKMDAVEAAKNDDDDKEESDEDEEEDDDKIDYFKADDSKEGEEDAELEYYYKDFFDPPLDEEGGNTSSKKKKNSSSIEDPKQSARFNLEEDEELEDEDDDDEQEHISRLENAQQEESNEEVDVATLSTFEKKRKRIEENIKAMEEQAMQPKSWQLTGEVTAQTRPENSLLEEHLIYDHLLRQAPEITTKTTQKLEDIIKQRVKDQSWDDVLRKIKPIEDISEYKKRLVLDAEKSKMSLTEIYEKEYVEKQDTEAIATEDDKDPEEHKTIQKDMQALFAKLDALSHFNYTPKAPIPEIKTITNASATSMEEITPSTFSEAMLLAPQEILEPAKGEIKGKAERTSTDKKRERRLKKKKQHLKRLSQEEKARAKGLGLRNIKLAESVVKKSNKKHGSIGDEVQNNKELKSSKAFFAKLQEQVHTHIDKVAKKNKASLDAKVISAKRYKL